MKTKFLIAAIMVVMIGAANAKDVKNYWVVETSAAGKSVVKIYDSNNALVKEENVERKIDVMKRKERKTLNKLVR